MVRDNDAIDPLVDCLACVIGPLHSLDQDRQTSVGTNKRQVFPGVGQIGKYLQIVVHDSSHVVAPGGQTSKKNWIADIIAEALAVKERKVTVIEITFPPAERLRIE